MCLPLPDAEIDLKVRVPLSGPPIYPTLSSVTERAEPPSVVSSEMAGSVATGSAESHPPSVNVHASASFYGSYR